MVGPVQNREENLGPVLWNSHSQCRSKMMQTLTVVGDQREVIGTVQRFAISLNGSIILVCVTEEVRFREEFG